MPERFGRTRAFIIGVAIASAAVTALIVAVPDARFAHRNPQAHVALEVAESVIALLAAFLIYGRVRRRRRLEDLLLSGALLSSAVGNLAFSALPAVLQADDSTFATWSALIARTVGAGLFAAAAIVPVRRVRLSRGREIRFGLLLLGALTVSALAVAVAGDALPHGVDTGVTPESSTRPRLDGHPVLLGAQLAGLVLYALAAVGFTRRYERTGDTLLRWLAIGAVLSAAARLNYFLYPSLFTDYVYVGDFFRLGFYAVILVAAAAEIQSYWSGMAATAALEERQRISRDLHDGIAQELASIQRGLRWMDEGDELVGRASASAERALAQVREAIVSLDEREPPPVGEALARALRTVADREGADVILDLEADVRVDHAEREALILIACEAVTNAARHAGGGVIRVELAGGRRPALRVRDFGRGFDPDADGDTGRRGLRGMRERAAGVGATLRVRSRPQEGTEVEVLL